MAKPGADEQTDLGGGRRGDSSFLRLRQSHPPFRENGNGIK